MMVHRDYQTHRPMFHVYVPSIQFTGKAGILGMAGKVSWHDFGHKSIAITDHKGASMRQPTDGFQVTFITQNLHETLRENL